MKIKVQLPKISTAPFSFGNGQSQQTAVPSFRDFVAQANPRYRWFPHVEQLAAVLEQVASGEIKRLMVFLPPRHGKSELVSRLFSAYYLYCFPDRWVGINSYSAKLAYTFSRNARENYKRVGGIVSGNAAAVEHWETDQGGGLWAAGVGGSITGKGFHCFSGETRVTTDIGCVTIAELYQSLNHPKVLSFNHETNNLEWKRILAKQVKPARHLIEITTHSGRRIRCTPEHLIFDPERGYRAADDFVPGDALIYISQVQELRDVRGANQPTHFMQTMLSQDTGNPLSCSLLPMRERISEGTIRVNQNDRAWSHGYILQFGMQPETPCYEKRSYLQDLRQANQNKDFPLLSGVFQGQKERALPKASQDRMRFLRGTISASFTPNGVLFQDLPKSRPFSQNEGEGKQPLQRRYKLRQMVYIDAADCARKRWGSLRSLRKVERHVQDTTQAKVGRIPEAKKVDSTPYRSQSHKQQGREFGHSLHGLSQVTPQTNGQWSTDTVSSVRKLRPKSQPVYDIQIEGNSNFFANGILAHNCGIIDDPIKNAEEAASETIREKHKEWYDSTFYTREEPGAAIIVIQTRWHEDDLSGYLLDKENEEPEHWTIVNFPAVKEDEHYQFPATCTVIPDTRREGEPLAPARYPLAKLNKIERRLGDYFWDALYQQRPKPKQGATFKQEWWQGQNRYDPNDRRVANRLIGRWLSFDTGLKDNLTSDYSACTVLEMLPDYTLTVRLVWRARLKFPGLVSEIADMARTFNKDDKLRGVIIEDKVSGTSAYQTLSASSPEWLAEILIAYNPQGAKEYRHELAAVWCKRDCILLPMPAESVPWLLDFERELFSDTSAHDDMKDSFTQGILYLEHYIATGWHARIDPPIAHTRPADFASGNGRQHDRVRQALIEAGYNDH